MQATPAEVCFYTETVAVGGAERAMFRLIEQLDRDVWSPRLALPPTPVLAQLCDLAAGHAVPVIEVPGTPLGLSGAVAARALVREFRRLAPTVFHAHLSQPLASKWALASAALARVPAVVATVHLTPYEVDRVSCLQLRALSRGVGAYIAVSSAVRADLITQVGLPAAKIEVIRNWVDPAPLLSGTAEPLRGELRGRPPQAIAFSPARLDHQKGLDILLEAASATPGVHFVIAGEGPDETALKRQAAELGLLESGAVSFLGPRADVPDLLAACDLVVLPSRYEGTSLAVLEAMASGRPIVSTAVPGTLEQLSDGVNALLVPPEDPAALAAAIRRMLDEPDLANRLAGAARARALSEFSPAVLTGATTAIYRRLLGARQPVQENS